MANVIETRILLALTDLLSPGLLKAQQNLSNLNKTASSTSSIFRGITAQAAGVTAALTGMYTAGGAIGELIKAPYEFAKNMETNQIGISGILQSMTELDGKTLEWNSAMRISNGILKDLNDAALRTAATSEDLIEAFRALLGPGLEAGMTIDQLKEFTTVGVNAVKSLGLPRNQIVQELRDMVQGGIRPQSSTLATSLGLTDADIKEAKNSAEGLYAFLMKRMEGFKTAALETPKTMAGLTDQIKEGYTRTSPIATEPLYDYYKEILEDIAELFLNQKTFELNSETVDNIKAFSEHVVNAAKGMGELGSAASTIVTPALEKAGTAAGFLADHTKEVGIAFAAWKIGNVALDIANVVTQTNNAYQTQTLLGTAVQKVNGYWNQNKIAAQGAYQQEIQAAKNAAVVIEQAERQKQTAQKTSAIVSDAVVKAARKDNMKLADDLALAAVHYQKLGVSAQEAGKLQLQAARQAAKGQLDLARQTLDAQEKHILAANAALEHGKKLQKMQNYALGAGSALTGLGVTVQMLTDDTNDFAQSMGDTAINVGIAISAIGGLIGWLSKLSTAYKEVAKMGAAAGLLTTLGTAGGTAIGTGLAVGAGTVGIYAGMNGLSLDDVLHRYELALSNTADNKYLSQGESDDWDLIENPYFNPRAMTENAVKAAKWTYDPDAALKEAMEEAKRLTLKDFGDKSAEKEDKKAKAAADKALKELTKWKTKIDELTKDLDVDIAELTQSPLEIAQAKLEAQIEEMNSTVERAKVAGVDAAEIGAVQEKINKYRELKEAQNNRDWVTESHNMEMERLQALEDSYGDYYSNIDAMRMAELENYKQQLAKMLESDKLTQEEMLRIQQEYAAASQDLVEAQASDMAASWENALDVVKNYQADFYQTYVDGFDSIIGEFESFGQNMITEQQSFSEASKELFKNLTNDILNMMMKVIMQGLVMNAIMSMFGIGGANNIKTAANGIRYQDFGGTIVSSVPSSTLKIGGGTRAKGGYSSPGLYLVGEEGPEVVDFSTPGRVYTAAQTKAMFSGESRSDSNNINIKVELINESGTPLEARQTSTTWDGESYVIGILIKAISTNRGGIKTLLKGVANS